MIKGRQQFNVFFRFLGFIILLLIATATPCFCELVYMPECQGTGCMQTAVPVKWPAPLKAAAFTVEVDRFVIQLPSLPKRVVRHLGGDVSFFCEDGSFLSFSLETGYSLAVGVETPEKSNFAVADSAEMTFTKTVADTPPSDPNDLWVWRQAIYLKTQAFRQDNHISQAVQKPLISYFWQDESNSITLMAYLFDSSKRNSYVRIFGKGITFEQFKNIIGSVKLSSN